LLAKDGGRGSSIAKGVRAMAIKLSHSDKGAFQPGSRVCVEFSYARNTGREDYKQTILENGLLLAVDAPLDADHPREGEGPWSEVVIVAVSAEDAQVLSLAQQMGTLRLVPPSGN